MFEEVGGAGGGEGDGSFAALHGLYWLTVTSPGDARCCWWWTAGNVCLFALGLVEDEASAAGVQASLEAVEGALRPHRAGDYPNFVEEPADASGFFDAATWARLREVKALYDPSDMFKGNHHVPPAAGAALRQAAA